MPPRRAVRSPGALSPSTAGTRRGFARFILVEIDSATGSAHDWIRVVTASRADPAAWKKVATELVGDGPDVGSTSPATFVWLIEVLGLLNRLAGPDGASGAAARTAGTVRSIRGLACWTGGRFLCPGTPVRPVPGAGLTTGHSALGSSVDAGRFTPRPGVGALELSVIGGVLAGIMADCLPGRQKDRAGW